MKSIIGRKFKELNKGKQYCVLIYNEDNSNEKMCETCDQECFTKLCKSGIRFIDITEIPNKISGNITSNVPLYLRKISFFDNSEITIDNEGKLRSNKLHFKSKEYFWSDPKYYNLCKEIVSINGEMLVNVNMTKYTEKQKKDICECAVNNNEWAIRFVNDKISNYYDLCKIAVGKHWHTISKISQAFITDEIFEIAVNKYEPNKHRTIFLLREIPLGYVEQTINRCLLFVKKNGLALKFVKDCFKSFDVCYSAVKNNGLSLEFVPSIDTGIFSEKELITLCKEAVSQNYGALQYCTIMNQEIFDTAIAQNPVAEYYLPEKFLSDHYVNYECNFINEEYLDPRFNKKHKNI